MDKEKSNPSWNATKKNKMNKAIRQGDICLLQVAKLPKGLKQSVNDLYGIILQNGSGGNPHTFRGGRFYSKSEGDFIIGYLEAKNTEIYHVEHSPKGDKIPDGTYEVRKQVEFAHEGLRPVID